MYLQVDYENISAKEAALIDLSRKLCLEMKIISRWAPLVGKGSSIPSNLSNT